MSALAPVVQAHTRVCCSTGHSHDCYQTASEACRRPPPRLPRSETARAACSACAPRPGRVGRARGGHAQVPPGADGVCAGGGLPARLLPAGRLPARALHAHLRERAQRCGAALRARRGAQQCAPASAPHARAPAQACRARAPCAVLLVVINGFAAKPACEPSTGSECGWTASPGAAALEHPEKKQYCPSMRVPELRQGAEHAVRCADQQIQSEDLMLMDMRCESGLRQAWGSSAGLEHAVYCADRQIQSEDMMLMDMGCEYYGYDRRAARRTRSGTHGTASLWLRPGFGEAFLPALHTCCLCPGSGGIISTLRIHAVLLPGLARLLLQSAVEQQAGQQPPGPASADRPCAPAATSPAASPPTAASQTASALCTRACSPRTRRAAHSWNA